MPVRLRMETILIFSDMESLEGVVRTMPWTEKEQKDFLETRLYTDDEDESDVAGVTSVVHKFTIEGEE